MIPNIRRLAGYLLLAFAVVSGGITWWQVADAQQLAARSDNPQVIAARRSALRGTIFDSRGVALATSRVVSGLSRRTYVDTAFSHVIGYSSLRYGTTGLEAAYELALHPQVVGISLGEADLRSQTGALEAGLDWARGRIVNAAVAAGLPRPPQSVYPQVRDLEGLAESCRRGRALGHLGRAAIHPDQLPVIEQAYLPTEEEVERARATIERLQVGVGTVGGGDFVDAAMLGAAQQIVAIAERYG